MICLISRLDHAFPIVKRRIKRIEILAVQLLLGDAQCFTKTLIMDDLTLS